MEKQIQEPEKQEIHDFEKLKPPVKPKTVLESFKYAVDGVLDVFRTQKHMRFHFVTVVLVLLVALMFELDKKDMLVLLFTVSLVLMAEMFNTAIEAVVDMVTQTYHPLAKFAKDAAAGAVLIATVTAILVGFLLFLGDTSLGRMSGGLRAAPAGIMLRVIVSGLVLVVLVTIMKALGSRGKLLKGGVVSGHTAAGFFFAATILYFSKNALAAIMAVMMALLIAQSRVEAKIHSVQEVITGALLALLLTAVVYWFVPS